MATTTFIPNTIYSTVDGTAFEQFAGDGDVPQLTTVFTPPSQCLTLSVAGDYDSYIWDGFAGGDNAFSGLSTCHPFSADYAIYSPGVCPSGQEIKEITAWAASYTDHVETTYHAWCCSSGYSITSDCGPNQIPSQLCGYTYCESFLSTPSEVWYYDSIPRTNGLGSAALATAEYGYVIGTRFEIWWNEKDFSRFPNATVVASLRTAMGLPPFPTSDSSPSTATSAQAPTSTAVNSDSSPHRANHSLSGGAIAGIVVGVLVGSLVLGALGYCALRRRWMKKYGPGHTVHDDNTNTNTNNNNNNHNHNPSTMTPMGSPKSTFSRMSWVQRWRKGDDAPQVPMPDVPEMDQGDHVYKEYSGGAWRAELQGAGSTTLSDGSQSEPRHSLVSQLTTTVATSPHMELEGSFPPPRQAPIPEEPETPRAPTPPEATDVTSAAREGNATGG
ncbi:hypothetical protein F4780DRAFT_502862 [Xylariomycetidae sp. FL0641]|nr:hypothetical protein F4780DRAFT_502862 [Xylariomycetidae sp. FL0641]